MDFNLMKCDAIETIVIMQRRRSQGFIFMKNVSYLVATFHSCCEYGKLFGFQEEPTLNNNDTQIMVIISGTVV